MATLDADRLLEGIQRWVAIETPTGVLRPLDELLRLVSFEAEAAGLKTEPVPGPNGKGDVLIARSDQPGDARLLVLAHLDTVHPIGALAANPWRVEGDKVYGPGVYDMKSGAFMALAAFRHLVAEGRRPALPLTILYATDEEIGSPAARPIIEREARTARYVLVVEPARDGGKIVVGRKGVARFVVRAHGRPSHSGSRPADGRSAIREMAHQILALETLADLERGVSVNVGTIQGGTAPNVVPEHCTIQVDVRVPTLALAEDVLTRIRALRPKDPDVTLEIEGELTRPPFDPSPEGRALFERARDLAAELGIALEGTLTGGGSDGNFTAAMGIPTLDGLGADGDGAHTGHEHVYRSSLAPRTLLLARLYETLA